MSLVVTGISQSADTKALEAALKAASLSIEQVSVVCGGSASEGSADSGIRFVYAGDASTSSLIGSGGGIMTSTDGTNVPGLSAQRGSREYFGQETISDLLGDLEIPDSSLENYIEAIEAGRCVFVYYAHTDTVARVEDVFRSLDLKNVTVY